MKRLTIVCLLGIYLVYPAFGLDLSNYLKEKSTQSDKEFLKEFPYQLYLKEVSLKDVNSLEKQRKILNKNKRDGDKFLYLLCQHYIENIDKDVQSLNNLLHLSQAYLDFSSNSEDGMVYEILGNMIMEEVVHQTESQIKEGTLSKNDRDVKDMIAVLKEHQFIINVTQSDWEKLTYHVSQGNWIYISDRMHKEIGIGLVPLLMIFLLGFSLVVWYRKSIFKASKNFTKSF
jgi:hypothetical protein